MNNIVVSLPDGAKVELPKGSNGFDLAKHISAGLAEKVVVARVNGQVQDLRDELSNNCSIQLLKSDSVEALDAIRHSCEHILAAAVCRLFPGAQVTMGPKTHMGEFYYDFDVGRAFTPEDLAKIEREMVSLIADKVTFQKRIVTKQEAFELFKSLGQRYKPEILDWITDANVSIYQCGDFVDLCRGPHVPNAGFIKAFKLLANSGTYWRADSNREMLQRITGIAFASQKELDAYFFQIEEAKKRDHRKLGRLLDLFHVSERFDSHEYPESQPIEMLVTGSVRNDVIEQGNIGLEKEVLQKVRDVFAGKQLRFNGFSVAAHGIEKTELFDIEVKLFCSRVDKENRAKLEQIEREFNEKNPEGRIKIVAESQFVEELGPGLVSWLPKGGRLRSTIEDISRKLHFQGGYEMVYSPHLAKSDLWKVSGHWGFYKESMFAPMCIDGHEYIVKPMNCPMHVLMYKHKPKSYRDLPVRLAEFGTVYRYELAGVMHGLMRVRGFTQDDAHLFCRWDQIDEEVDQVIGFVLRMLKLFGFSKFEVNLATRPEKFVGDVKNWERAEEALKSAVIRHGLPFTVDEGGGAFYGPKIDVKLRDSLDRLWQCSTVQLDFNLPERFGLSFINNEGKPEQPVMLHRALFGSMERFVGILIEEYAGAFPIWLAPEQARILTISDRHLEQAQKLQKILLEHDLRVTIHTASDKLGQKIRQAQLDKIPLMLVIGDKEAEQGGASVRLREGEDLGFMNEADLVSFFLKRSNPFTPLQLENNKGIKA